MFGGCGSGKDRSFNDLNKFDIHKKVWTKLEAFGQFPAPREAHIAQVLSDNKMVIHGGINSDSKSFDDTWVLATFNSKLDRMQSQMNFSSGLFSADDNRKRGAIQTTCT
jgi:N-acetylneuraminic acid mutarotase